MLSEVKRNEPAHLSPNSSGEPLTCTLTKSDNSFSLPTSDPNIDRILARVSRCRKRTLVVIDKKSGNQVAKHKVCGMPRHCEFCRNCKINNRLDVFRKALAADLSQPLYVIDIPLEEEYEKLKRNIRLKNPTLLAYFPHDEGTTLVTTEPRYGGRKIFLNDIRHDEWSTWVIPRPGYRGRIMGSGVVLCEDEKETTTVEVETIETDAPIGVVTYAAEVANEVIESSQQDLPIQEKIQAKLDLTASLLGKYEKYVVQRVFKRYKVNTTYATCCESFNLDELRLLWREASHEEEISR